MGITELAVLKWVHIVAMVYWLGGEWGVFQTSRCVVDHKLSMDERRRHMETAYRIDILARTGILLLFPVGWHMGHLWGVQPFGGIWLTAMWIFFGAWLLLCWAAYYHRETDLGITLTKLDEAIRFVFIPAIFIASASSLLGYGPFEAGAGQKWFSIKIMLFSFLLCIGLHLRFVMREWTVLFRRLATESDTKSIERTLERSLALARKLAYIYWIGIGSVAFVGATKFM